MLRRLALPLGVVLLLAAIGVVSVQLGYLGRKDGGPLDVRGSASSRTGGGETGSRWASVAWPVGVKRGRVRIVRGRPQAVSPGVRVSALRFNRSTRVTGRGRRWPPPRDGGRAAGQRLRSPGRGSLVVGLKARRPGVYLLDGFVVDYDQGARSYRRTFGQTACAGVRNPCARDLRLPRGGRIADLGGPSRYGVELRDSSGRGPGTTGVDVLAGATLNALYPPSAGARRIRITLANRTKAALRLTGLRGRLELPGAGRPGRLRVTGPREAITIPGGASRSVRLTVAFEGCAGDQAVPVVLRELRATVDGHSEAVPLLVRIGLRAGRRTC